jgi:hypothetical protein
MRRVARFGVLFLLGAPAGFLARSASLVLCVVSCRWVRASGGSCGGAGGAVVPRASLPRAVGFACLLWHRCTALSPTSAKTDTQSKKRALVQSCWCPRRACRAT